MNRITSNQNKLENLKKLAAQRRLYTKAKKILLLQIILTVPVTILLSFLKIIFPNDLTVSLVALYGIILAIIDKIALDFLISKLRRDAAKIQEDFDCAVYEMEWNKIFIGSKISPEKINKYAKEYIPNSETPLENWYPIEIAKLSLLEAITICQKTNLHYDSSLRNKYKVASLWACCITFLILVLVSLLSDFTVRNFLLQVIAPFLPVIVLTIKINIEHAKAIESSEALQNIMYSMINSKAYSMHSLRKVQDKIFCSRKDSLLIPDFFYNINRQELEDEMHENAQV